LKTATFDIFISSASRRRNSTVTGARAMLRQNHCAGTVAIGAADAMLPTGETIYV
jgi:hypothetical protein